METIQIGDPCVVMSHNSHLYTVLGGNFGAMEQAALKVRERNRFKTPGDFRWCSGRRHSFCQSCFSLGDKVVSGMAPECVGLTRLETPATHEMDPFTGLAVTPVTWGDIIHPDSACTCPESCAASVHRVRVFAPSKWGVYARLPDSLHIGHTGGDSFSTLRHAVYVAKW